MVVPIREQLFKINKCVKSLVVGLRCKVEMLTNTSASSSMQHRYVQATTNNTVEALAYLLLVVCEGTSIFSRAVRLFVVRDVLWLAFVWPSNLRSSRP